ncbi:uncharacterized protein N7477_005434 [Penicillium maclennaniae]|uniref:uncharacterized protein n=1 Tax=Penicillium maclennaniae TaxID=1343394 RepID=UPI0025408C57|nr:uncharacterized protein N7477_005434 [Penicillium maclennaniae]KAJ5670071.1 hypothetical protein N7477_005434 [Penicillium maclennaniae]
MANRIHVAVLDADIPCLSVYSQRGLYSSQFRVLLQKAADRLNKSDYVQLQNGPLAVHVTAFDAVRCSLPPLESLRVMPPSPETHEGPFGAIDAILITGSAHSAYDPYPWIAQLQSFIQTVHANYPLVKIFGSCFGHQLIAQALLSTSARPASAASTFHVEHSSNGFEMGIQPITLDPSFTVIPTAEAEAAAAAASAGEVSLPAPWMNIGSSAACPVQGLYNPGRVLSYQGHFEFDAWTNRELCIEFGRRAKWSQATIAAYLECIERSLVPGSEDNDDSKAAAEAVLLFFAGEDQPKTIPIANGMLTPPLDSAAGWMGGMHS